MTTCTHSDLHVEEGTHYRCPTCGQRFITLRVDESRETDAVDETPGASVEVDVSGQVNRYVVPDRRLPPTRR